MEPGELGPCTRRSTHSRLTIVVAGAVACLLLVTLYIPAKEKKPQTRTVSGVVSDEAGNIIDGAAVELKDLQTGKVLEIYSQEDGQYQFADLSFSHDYTIKASYKGASSDLRHISSIESRARLVLNLTISQSHN